MGQGLKGRIALHPISVRAARETTRQSRWNWLAGFLALALALISFSALGEEYRLGTQDKLKIRVAEWQTIEGTIREWSAVSGEYTVGASGNLSLPFVGETPAAGKTTAEIAETISKTLHQKFGLAEKPDATVELVEYRPFYITGDVQTPGQYPYAPGLTVVKAVSVAGGTKQSSSGQRVERDFLNAKGSFDVLAEERLRLLAKRARLKAETEGASGIELPVELASNPKAPALLAEETAILSVRQGQLERQLAAMEDLRELLQNEIDSLERKSATQERQIDLAKRELSGIGTLKEKGLVENTRVLNAERTIADLEGRLLDYETAILQAKQDISKATQDAINLENSRDAGLAIRMQQVEADLVETNLKMDMYRGLMSEALSVAPEAALSDEDVEVIYRLVRGANGKMTEIEASENTPVQPGDVIKVSIMLMPETGSAGQ
jgi:exopolysaccharide production protein ExoF